MKSIGILTVLAVAASFVLVVPATADPSHYGVRDDGLNKFVEDLAKVLVIELVRDLQRPQYQPQPGPAGCQQYQPSPAFYGGQPTFQPQMTYGQPMMGYGQPMFRGGMFQGGGYDTMPQVLSPESAYVQGIGVISIPRVLPARVRGSEISREYSLSPGQPLPSHFRFGLDSVRLRPNFPSAGRLFGY